MTRRLEAYRPGQTQADPARGRVDESEQARIQALSRRAAPESSKPGERPQRAGHAEDLQSTPKDAASSVAGQIDTLLADFVTPPIPDPTVLRRSISIMQNCISDVVPRLGGGAQLQELAASLMTDEIERRLEFLGRTREGLES